jgi:hypothetical protein
MFSYLLLNKQVLLVLETANNPDNSPVCAQSKFSPALFYSTIKSYKFSCYFQLSWFNCASTTQHNSRVEKSWKDLNLYGQIGRR